MLQVVCYTKQRSYLNTLIHHWAIVFQHGLWFLLQIELTKTKVAVKTVQFVNNKLNYIFEIKTNLYLQISAWNLTNVLREYIPYK